MQNDPGGKKPPPSNNPLDKFLNRNKETPPENPQNKGEEKPRPRVPSWIIGALIVALIGWYVYQYFLPQDDSSSTSVPYSVVVSEIESSNVTEAVIDTTSIEVDLENDVFWDNENDRLVESADENSATVTTDSLKATIPPIVVAPDVRRV